MVTKCTVLSNVDLMSLVQDAVRVGYIMNREIDQIKDLHRVELDLNLKIANLSESLNEVLQFSLRSNVILIFVGV